MKKNEKKLACFKSFSYISTVIDWGEKLPKLKTLK